MEIVGVLNPRKVGVWEVCILTWGINPFQLLRSSLVAERGLLRGSIYCLNLGFVFLHMGVKVRMRDIQRWSDPDPDTDLVIQDL